MHGAKNNVERGRILPRCLAHYKKVPSEAGSSPFCPLSPIVAFTVPGKLNTVLDTSTLETLPRHREICLRIGNVKLAPNLKKWRQNLNVPLKEH